MAFFVQLNISRGNSRHGPWFDALCFVLISCEQSVWYEWNSLFLNWFPYSVGSIVERNIKTTGDAPPEHDFYGMHVCKNHSFLTGHAILLVNRSPMLTRLKCCDLA